MEWKATERMRSPYYRRAEKEFFKGLMQQFDPIIRAARARGDISAAEFARLISEEPIWEKFEYVYKETGTAFAERTHRQFMGESVARVQFESAMESYVIQNCSDKVTSITNVTREYAKKIINQTIVDNPTSGSRELGREIVKNIRKQGGQMAQWRGRTIARTEVATASGVGQQIAAEATGLPMVKQWLHSGGRDARISHQEMNGQDADIKGYFIFSDGTRMYTPRDPSAPPEHVINCRCDLIYKVRPGIQEGSIVKPTVTIPNPPPPTPTPSVGSFVRASNMDDAAKRINATGVQNFEKNGYGLDQANATLEALENIPKQGVPDTIVGSAAGYERYMKVKIERSSKSWYGVSNNYQSVNWGAVNDLDKFKTNHLVGINTSQYKTVESLTKRKEYIQQGYKNKYGNDYFFNTDGRLTHYHEFGHTYFNKKYSAAFKSEWPELSKRWHLESKTDILKSNSEAFAEAFADYYGNGGKRLPDYIKGFFDKNVK